jgi:hypothetical protein
MIFHSSPRWTRLRPVPTFFFAPPAMGATAPPDALRALMSARTSSRSFFGLRAEEYWWSPSRRRDYVA